MTDKEVIEVLKTRPDLVEMLHRAAELERDGERPVWTAQDIAVVIRNMIARDEGNNRCQRSELQ